MLAQQVDGDSFEEEPPYRFSYRRELDKPYRPWYPDGAVHVAQFSLDMEGAFNGRRSQKSSCHCRTCARAWLKTDST